MSTACRSAPEADPRRAEARRRRGRGRAGRGRHGRRARHRLDGGLRGRGPGPAPSPRACASSAFRPRSERRRRRGRPAFRCSSFAEHRQIDLTIDGADEVERGTLNLIKGLGGALLREKIVANASRRLAIVVDGGKLVDRLGTHAPVPVEVVALRAGSHPGGLSKCSPRRYRLRLPPAGDLFVTDGGNRILDCRFAGPIADPARLEDRIRRSRRRGRERPVHRPRRSGVRRRRAGRPSPRQRARPSRLVRRSWWSWACRAPASRPSPRSSRRASAGPFEEGDALHPEANVAKMHAGIPLTDEDRQPWLERVAAWIDGQRAGQAARHHHLLRAQAGRIAGSSSATGRKYGWSICAAAATSWPSIWRDAQATSCPASLLQSQIDTLEEPGPDEDPLTVDVGPRGRPDRPRDHPPARRVATDRA